MHWGGGGGAGRAGGAPGADLYWSVGNILGGEEDSRVHNKAVSRMNEYCQGLLVCSCRAHIRHSVVEPRLFQGWGSVSTIGCLARGGGGGNTSTAIPTALGDGGTVETCWPPHAVGKRRDMQCAERFEQ